MSETESAGHTNSEMHLSCWQYDLLGTDVAMLQSLPLLLLFLCPFALEALLLKQDGDC